MIGLGPWLREMWPRDADKRALLADYGRLKDMPHFLADLALRAGVWRGAARVPGDIFGDGISEGRRLMALEIIKLAKAPPGLLLDLAADKPVKGDNDA